MTHSHSHTSNQVTYHIPQLVVLLPVQQEVDHRSASPVGTQHEGSPTILSLSCVRENIIWDRSCMGTTTYASARFVLVESHASETTLTLRSPEDERLYSPRTSRSEQWLGRVSHQYSAGRYIRTLELGNGGSYARKLCTRTKVMYS